MYIYIYIHMRFAMVCDKTVTEPKVLSGVCLVTKCLKPFLGGLGWINELRVRPSPTNSDWGRGDHCVPIKGDDLGVPTTCDSLDNSYERISSRTLLFNKQHNQCWHLKTIGPELPKPRPKSALKAMASGLITSCSWWICSKEFANSWATFQPGELKDPGIEGWLGSLYVQFSHSLCHLRFDQSSGT